MEILVKMIFGSHLYGTDTPDSDTDYKGIYLPSFRDCILGNIKTTLEKKNDVSRKNTSSDVDESLYSLQHFAEMASTGKLVAIDMLHAPDCMLVLNSPIWYEIRRNRHRFYTKRLSGCLKFVREHAAKYSVRSSRISAIEEVFAVLDRYGEDIKISAVWDELPANDHCKEVRNPKEDRWRFYQVCGKMISETMKIKHARESIMHTYKQYGTRAHLARSNEGINWKALSHAYRAGLQIREIFKTGDLKFPLKEAGIVRDLKLGRLHYLHDGVGDMLEELHADVEKLSSESNFPDTPDTEWLEDFVIDCYKRKGFLCE